MLDPNVFLDQMNRLKVLPVQGGFEGPDEFAWRKVVYYEALQHLEDGAFVSACATLLKEPGRVFFPTPGEIVKESEAWKPAPEGRLLPMGEEAMAQLEAEREERRANAKGLLDYLKAELEKRRELPPGDPVASMPEAKP